MSELDQLIEWMGANQYFIGNDLLAKVKELKDPKKSSIKFSKVLEAVQKTTGITIEQMQIKQKQGDIPFARHLVYYFGKSYAKKSLVYMANYLNHKDHTSGINGIKKLRGYIETKDEKTINAIAEINILLNS